MAAAIAVEPAAERGQKTPENLGRGLYAVVQALKEERLAGRPEREAIESAVKVSERARVDSTQRLLVDVCLDGRATVAEIGKTVEQRGGRVTARIEWYRKGLLSTWLPLAEVERLAGTRGVSAVHLAPRRHLRVGKATTQGSVVLNAAKVNAAGYLGAGITVGALSDSYNDDKFDAADPGWSTAPEDVASGDLPGIGNPFGHNTPVNVVEDDNEPQYDTDEGRAMLQIVHDVAPEAALAFCTAGNTDAQFAANIAMLQSTAGCQVMCDDIGFEDEPMFSDGVIAQAINTAAAQGVSYFSAIGNDGNSGYQATFAPVSSTIGQTRAKAGGVNLATLPASEKAAIYQWHAFGTDANENPIVVQNIKTGTASTTLIFQWDDPFDVVNGGGNGITTDYDILVFSATGSFLANLSGTANNISTNEPIELPNANLAANTSYKICIVLTTRVNGFQPRLAKHLRYVATNDTDIITGDYINLSNVAAFGHPYAAGSTGVAAYNYDSAPDPGNDGHAYRPLVESYSSNGPIDIYFDSLGNRLSTPEMRQQPVLAAVDNVDTSFFPPSPRSPNANDYEVDGFPNFAGTSAATPHAAAVAALLLNAAAVNHESVTPQQIQSIMAATTQGQIDEDPVFTQATAGPIAVTDSGDGFTLTNTFKISFSGAGGQTLTQLVIDLSPINMHFDTTSANEIGTPFTILAKTGSPAPKAATPVLSGGITGQSTATINLTNFAPGDTLSFTIGFVDDDTGLYGYDADELGGASNGGGATISATLSGVVTPYTGAFVNQLGHGFNYKAGFGLLDAQAALNMLLGN